jgi:hypothetical protein
MCVTAGRGPQRKGRRGRARHPRSTSTGGTEPDEVDEAGGEHDQGEGGVGAVESGGSAREPHPPGDCRDRDTTWPDFPAAWSRRREVGREGMLLHTERRVRRSRGAIVRPLSGEAHPSRPGPGQAAGAGSADSEPTPPWRRCRRDQPPATARHRERFTRFSSRSCPPETGAGSMSPAATRSSRSARECSPARISAPSPSRQPA